MHKSKWLVIPDVMIYTGIDETCSVVAVMNPHEGRKRGKNDREGLVISWADAAKLIRAIETKMVLYDVQ
jgi:hypothetical protein